MKKAGTWRDGKNEPSKVDSNLEGSRAGIADHLTLIREHNPSLLHACQYHPNLFNDFMTYDAHILKAILHHFGNSLATG